MRMPLPAHLPQCLGPPQLAEQHRDELAPTRKPPRMTLGPVFMTRLLEFHPRK